MLPNHSVRQSIGWNIDMKDALESLSRDRHSDISGVSKYAFDMEMF
jgi:hypothetical protein